MAFILHIETSTPLCSVAISNNSDLLYELNSDSENDHASVLTILIDKLLTHLNLPITNLNAVSVSAGPGSYTGLRIGVSTAKGICHALNIPLITVNTLQAMVSSVINNHKADLYCPMVDARRMEVYCALYDKEMHNILTEDARIVDENIFIKFLEKNQIIFFGSGAEKCRNVLFHQNTLLTSYRQSAGSLITIAYTNYMNKQFADLAYFEPNYIKSFYTKTVLK